MTMLPILSKDARLPVQLQRAMAAEAEAAREARAKVGGCGHGAGGSDGQDTLDRVIIAKMMIIMIMMMKRRMTMFPGDRC